MSVAAPTTMTVTGGASVTLTFSAWSVTTPTATWQAILATTFTGLNGHTTPFSAFFDNAPLIVADIAAQASVSTQVAQNLFYQLRYIVSMYLFQALQTSGVPFSIALA